MAARSQTLLPSAARSATLVTDVFTAPPSTGAVTIILDLTVRGAAETITATLQILDPASGKFIDLTTATFTTAAVGTYSLIVAEEAAATYTIGTTVAKIGPVPPQMRVNLVHSGGTAHTYSVGAHFS